jgi:DNA-binding transcriptional ArsR family regulator
MDTEQRVAVDSAAIRKRASTAFSILGNETRLAILYELWESQGRYDSGSYASSRVTFSELRERVGMRDSGQFSYHLEQLVGEFVQKGDAGYTITGAGSEIIRAVVGTVGVENPAPNPVAVPNSCWICNGTTELRYDDGKVFHCCTECSGFWYQHESQPPGLLSYADTTRSAFAGRDLVEVADAVRTRQKTKQECFIQGVCSTCLGVVARSLVICDDHDPEGVCDDCGTRFEAYLHLECVVCKHWISGPVNYLMRLHPAVSSMYIERGVPFTYEPETMMMRPAGLWPVGELTQSVVSVDPPAVRVTLTYEGGELSYVIDENLELTEVTAA